MNKRDARSTRERVRDLLATAAPLNLSEMARLLGVSRERVRQIYSEQFPDAAPRAAFRRAVQYGRFRQLIAHPRLGWFLLEAVRRGLPVELPPTSANPRTVVVNGHRVNVAAPRFRPFLQRRARHAAYCRVSLANARRRRLCYVAVRTPDGDFVIPAAFGADRPVQLYLRGAHEPYQNRVPRVDWSRYIGAWELLALPHDPVAGGCAGASPASRRSGKKEIRS